MRSMTTAMLVVERRRGRDLREDMLALFAAGETQTSVARLYGLDPSTVNRWMERLGIPSRRWTLPTTAERRAG